LYTSPAVFIGNEKCKIVDYYSNDHQIVCITPKCYTDSCLSTNLFSGYSSMQVSIYVSSVEGILSAFTTFTYYNYWTPSIFQLQRYSYGKDTASVVAYTRNSQLSDLDIVIGDGYHANLGSEGLLNADSFYTYQYEKTFYFYPPSDMPANFLNFSFSIQNDQSNGYVGTGLARMFASGRYDTGSYDRYYLYDSTIQGTIFSFVVFPTVTSVSPSNGSLAGGTEILIKGTGFSYNSSEFEVLVGGRPCKVIRSDFTSISCVTSPIISVSEAAIETLSVPRSKPVDVYGDYIASERLQGSPGWWIKVWNWNDYSTDKSGDDTYARLSFPWRKEFYFSFYEQFGYYWYSSYQFNGDARYAHDAGTILIAPFTGYYTFYVGSDDISNLYGSKSSIGDNEVLLAYNTYYVSQYGDFWSPQQHSPKTVLLQKNEKYYLRYRNVNTGGPDYSLIALRISPLYDNDGILVEKNTSAPELTSLSSYQCPSDDANMMSNYHPNFLRYHSLREIQEVSIVTPWFREIQMINISGCTSGNYEILVEGKTLTSVLALTATSSQIRSALTSAGEYISSVSVTKEGINVIIKVEFDVDKEELLTMLQVFSVDLDGPYPDVAVTRLQQHSPLPTGSFYLTYGSSDEIEIAHDSTSTAFQSAIENALGRNFNVEVSRSGWWVGGWTWSVTFLSPRGDIPNLSVSRVAVEGPNGTTVTVSSLRNGSLCELWFEPLPPYMTELPLDWATQEKYSSVEVYKTASNGDRLKAVCDSSDYENDPVRRLMKGNESACKFYYASKSTALIRNVSVVRFVDDQTTEIGISGENFDLGDNSTINITVATEVCRITSISSTYITCEARNIPWGHHNISLLVIGKGSALSVVKHQILFKQAIYSVEPTIGSLAGGQILEILGRGFNKNASIHVGTEPCELLSWRSDRIRCRTPPISATYVPLCNGTTTINNGTATINNCMDANFTVIVSVDGMAAPGLYEYHITMTPIVHSVNPNDISAAITTTVTIIGSGFGSTLANQTIFIGDFPCRIVELEDDLAVCVLIRSGPMPLREVPVKFYIPNKGYAAEASFLGDIPIIFNGYELSSVYPSEGSLYGGTEIILDGYGFFTGYPQRHTVKFVPTSILSDYDTLLITLGLESPPDVLCEITFVDLRRIKCVLPEKMNVTSFNSTSYTVSVTLNGLESVCSSDDQCGFTQTWSSTPVINGTEALVINEQNGEINFHLTGNKLLLGSGEIDVFLNETIACDTISSGEHYANIRCPSVAAGVWNVGANVPSLGFAYTEEVIELGIAISQVSFSAQMGSIAGGAIVTLKGYGFSSVCKENVIALKFLELTSSSSLSQANFISCTSNIVQFYTPNMLYAVDFEETSLRLSNITVSVNGISASVSTFFSYSLEHTPILGFSTAMQGYFGSQLSFVVSPQSLFTVQNVSVTVSLDGKNCEGLDITGSSWGCTVPKLDGDTTNDVLVNVYPYGYGVTDAWYFPEYYSEFSTDTVVTAIQSSIAGGKTIEVTGKGLSNNTIVKICGVQCETSSVSYDSVTVLSPARLTMHGYDTFSAMFAGDFDQIVTLTGTSYASYSSSTVQQRAIDGDYTTYYSHYSQSCYIGISLPTGYYAHPYRMRFYPRLQFANKVGKSVYEASADGGQTYDILATLSSAHEGWNFVNANSTNKWYNTFRFRSIDNSITQCMLAEVKFLGVLAVQDEYCDIEVASNVQGAVHSIGKVHFGVSSTSYVSSITPDRGSALGNTTVTITGGNFSSSPIVQLNQVPCLVLNSNSTVIQCMTLERPYQIIAEHSVDVLSDTGYAVVTDSAQFLYVDKWSALTSWKNQEPPVDNDFVWIPRGQAIELDVNSPILFLLVIEGDLYFDPTADITLDSYYIHIFGGNFQVGTEKNPYEKKAVITLHGDRYKNIEIPMIGSKCLAAQPRNVMAMSSHGDHMLTKYRGSVEIHGQKRLRTWTKLRETAY